jgi:hypothetical protein
MQEIAVHWSLHRTTVAEHLRRAGAVTRQRGMPAGQLEKVIHLYGEGWSCQRLGKLYGCNPETVRQTLRRVGVRLRAPWERG